MLKGTILLIDDEEKLRGLLARILGLEGYTVMEAASAKAGLKTLEREDVQLVISDVRLPDANGVELAEKLKSLYPAVEIIVLTAYGTIADGVKAIKNGAFDYITKGDDNDKIIPLASRAVEKAQLQQRVQQLEKKVGQRYGFDSILGHSQAIRETIALAQKVAATDTTVLLTGETGTGKEVFAQAIHYSSGRRQKPFVAVNCSALGKDILESELFGYKAGAFTGATQEKKGLFEEANGGTLFLDELGEMSLDLQAKLLRVLETHEFIKVGATKPTPVNVRIVSATNRDLMRESEVGHFRSDLYYRVSVFQIELPALRQRPQDIDVLAETFLQQYAAKTNKTIRGIRPEAMEKLRSYPWRGNIRELKNVMERAAILTDDPQISLQHLPFEIQTTGDHPATDAFDLAVVEKHHIQKVLHYTQGNKTQAAKLLNVALNTLYNKIREYGISEG